MTTSQFVQENHKGGNSCEEANETNDKTKLVQSSSIKNLEEGNSF